jgi:hypothetical protein
VKGQHPHASCWVRLPEGKPPWKVTLNSKLAIFKRKSSSKPMCSWVVWLSSWFCHVWMLQPTMNAEVRMGGGRAGKKTLSISPDRFGSANQIVQIRIQLYFCCSDCWYASCDDIYEFQRLKPAQCHWHWSAWRPAIWFFKFITPTGDAPDNLLVIQTSLFSCVGLRWCLRDSIWKIYMATFHKNYISSSKRCFVLK